MTTDRTADGAVSPELEAIAAAAHDRLHAQPARIYPLSTRPTENRQRPRGQRLGHRGVVTSAGDVLAPALGYADHPIPVRRNLLERTSEATE
jgi:hypothetical protein